MAVPERESRAASAVRLQPPGAGEIIGCCSAARRTRLSAPTPARTTIVVPCFNEAQRLDVDAFERFAAAEPGVRFLFVDDGSTDDTLRVLRALEARCPDRVSVLEQRPNAGKAAVVRAGVLAALCDRPDFVGYWDADLATPLDEIPRFLEVLAQRPDCDVVFGSRVQLLGRTIERRPVRHYLGRVFATAASSMLGLPIYDTQCGAKLFRATPALEELFARPFQVNWTFDVELVARLVEANRTGRGRPPADRIYELPLCVWRDIAGSRVRPSDFPRAILEMLRIRRAYRLGPAPGPGPRPGRARLRAALATAALLALLAEGLWAAWGRDARHHIDARVLYVAGQCWLAGGSPYEAEAFATTWRSTFSEVHPRTFVFAYPPTVAVISVPMALLPWPAGGRLLAALNASALIGCLLLIALSLRAALRERASWSRIALGLALASTIGAIPATLQIGQTGLLALLGALACLTTARAGPTALFAAGALLASIKPQVSLIAVAIALVQARARRVAWAVASVVLVGGASLAAAGGAEALEEAFRAVLRYSHASSNRAQALAGLQPLLQRTGIEIATLPVALAGIVLAAVLVAGAAHRAGPRAAAPGAVAPLLPCALAFALSALFLPLHEYDLVLLMLPLAALVAMPAPAALGIAPGLLLAARPQPVARLLAQSEVTPLLEGVGLLWATAGLVWLTWRRRAAGSEESTGTRGEGGGARRSNGL